MKAAGLLLAILLAAGTARAQDYLNCHFAPGWEQSGPKRQYAADNLYDYKDGAAEGYLIYGFARMQGIDCKSGGDTLTIDVSEMNDADSAYGIFTANRDPSLPIANIGMGGQMQPQSATFAKGKYYVEMVVIAASPDSDHSAALQAFVTGIEERLEGRVTAPEALAVVPSREPRLHPPSPGKRAGAKAAQARLRGHIQARAGVYRPGGLAAIRRRGPEKTPQAF